jgi:hypothetical protein
MSKSREERLRDGVEQPPDLTDEENAILDRIWDEFGARQASQRRADDAHGAHKSHKSGWPYEPGGHSSTES